MAGSVVTSLRTDVQYFVTEYGCVNLMYCDIPERCRRLISIAHPDFRDELTHEAKKLGYLYYASQGEQEHKQNASLVAAKDANSVEAFRDSRFATQKGLQYLLQSFFRAFAPAMLCTIQYSSAENSGIPLPYWHLHSSKTQVN